MLPTWENTYLNKTLSILDKVGILQMSFDGQNAEIVSSHNIRKTL